MEGIINGVIQVDDKAHGMYVRHIDQYLDAARKAESGKKLREKTCYMCKAAKHLWQKAVSPYKSNDGFNCISCEYCDYCPMYRPMYFNGKKLDRSKSCLDPIKGHGPANSELSLDLEIHENCKSCGWDTCRDMPTSEEIEDRMNGLIDMIHANTNVGIDITTE